jgi:hypothetical protein
MPKRVIDGEALWLSNKLRQVPEEYRPEYANLIPLALANGTFECDPRKIWARVYIYNRPSVTLQAVEEMLDSFERAKMLFRWQAGDGAVWGYWIGIDKPGRLPSGTDQRNGAKGAAVPQESLQSFISSGNRAQPDNDQSVTGQGLVEDRCGFGLGSGIGSGSGKSLLSEPVGSDEQVSKPTPRKEPSPEGAELANLLRAGIIGNNPDANVTESHVREWGREADRMMRKDKRTSAAIRELIEFSQEDPFWWKNIRSMATLRKQFDQLWVKRPGSAKQATAHGSMPQRRSELNDEGRAVYERAGVAL